MVLESAVIKPRGIYLSKNLIRNLIRLRLELRNVNGSNSSSSSSNTHHRNPITATRSITTTSRAHSSSSPGHQASSRIGTTAGTKSTLHSSTSRNSSIEVPKSYRSYSTLSKNNDNNNNSNNNKNKNNRDNKANDKSGRSASMKVAAKNIMAAVFFTSLLVEESYMVNRGKGVLRYDVAQLPSNNPIEDARSEQIIQVPIETPQNEAVNSDWLLFAVFDGHAGYNTSTKLKNELIGQIIGELTEVYKLNDSNKARLVPDSNSVDQAIRSGFLKLDDEIVNKSIEKLLSSSSVNKSQVSELLMPALSGSCALVSFYDTYSKVLKVAVTGDSRALLGSLNADNEWTVEQLSIDQTGSNPTEVSRMIREHPNEPDVIKRGRVLGSLEPTRSFGDARYKWTQKIQDKIYSQFFGRKSPPNLLSPPYVTADPVITTTQIDPSRNQFLVMASDGLYEMLTNEEIVGLVVRWMENENLIQKPQEYGAGSFIKSFFSASSSSSSSAREDAAKLPRVIDLTATPESSKQAFRRTNTSEGVSFLMEDANVSTHLIRNALSNGGSKEHSEMLASIPSPLSRRYRDDLTVTVVFFGSDGEPNDSGKLEMNFKATNEKGGNVEPKAKL